MQEGSSDALSWSQNSHHAHHDYFLLFLGILLILLGSNWIRIGKAWTRFDGWLYREQESKEFWWQVAMYYLSGIGVLLYILFREYR
jgi:hypothetical protein